MDIDADFSDYAASRWHTLVRTGVLLGCSVTDAEDLAQQTLLRCYLKWANVERAADRDAYVARVQLNLLRQSRRRRWWGERASDRLPDRPMSDTTAQIDDADAVARALRQLPDAQRQSVVLRHYLHLTEQQIAQATGVARGTVKSRLSRALAALAANPDLAALREGRP
ncbi:SigE family RNA polymerase sigma factor [Nocardioides daejeonensis]|uniref:SigE family RNA polymerase sigma factor n=1 Tax=Nocardioides daejeonensis TaxID=1046556 RepID=UPI000D7478AB|nr:SigE family RNA polymerase sigma factor [Nocardioides daejeonensis]